MARKLNLKNTNLANKENIKSTSIREKNLNFSFTFLSFDHDACCFDSQDSIYFLKVLERLKGVSSITVKEFTSGTSKSLRNHPIKWEDTDQKQGFSHLNEQYQLYIPYQFAVSANEYGRVHGFIIDNTFHVVWLDPNHKVYPGKP